MEDDSWIIRNHDKRRLNTTTTTKRIQYQTLCKYKQWFNRNQNKEKKKRKKAYAVSSDFSKMIKVKQNVDTMLCNEYQFTNTYALKM